MSPQELKRVLESGLLSFPLTDFDAQLNFDPAGYAARLDWLQPYGASALFAAGGTGEFFSLEPGEYSEIIRVALDTCRGRTPILAGAGGPTRVAIQYAQEAERLGAQGILLLPHYLTEASQAGLIAHVEQVCKSVDFGVIVYNRNVCKLLPESLEVGLRGAVFQLSSNLGLLCLRPAAAHLGPPRTMTGRPTVWRPRSVGSESVVRPSLARPPGQC